MSQWKIIVATLVIFSTGFFAGVLFPRGQAPASITRATPNQTPPPPLPNERRIEALRRFTQDMDLSEEQRSRIQAHIQESQERTRLLWDLVGPEVQDEFKRLRSEVVAELSPEQRKRFEERSKKYRRERAGHPDSRDNLSMPPAVPRPPLDPPIPAPVAPPRP